MMSGHNGRRVSFEIWPFHKDFFNGITPEDSAWPHKEGKVSGPLIGLFEWSEKGNDDFWIPEIKKTLEKLHEVALEEGCTTKLKAIRNKHDPKNVMGQAAGFII